MFEFLKILTEQLNLFCHIFYCSNKRRFQYHTPLNLICPVFDCHGALYRGVGWALTGIRLYTGIHSVKRNAFWHNFWNKKLSFHKNADTRVSVFTTPLHYNNDVPSEKGVDIRIALDLVRAARLGRCDVAVLFSRDTDFAEAAKEIRAIAHEKQRWIKIASVMPDHPDLKRGIDGTDWIRLSRQDYDKCLDPNDYR